METVSDTGSAVNNILWRAMGSQQSKENFKTNLYIFKNLWCSILGQIRNRIVCD